MTHLTRKISGGGCQGDHCPAVWETSDPSVLAVQGSLPEAASLDAAGQVPAGEGVVLIPAALLREPGISGQR